MSKRPYPWEEDYQRQFKTHVNDQSARCNNSAHMNDVYERTHALLFEGARRAAMQPAMPQDGLPGSSNQPPDVLDTISNMGDMEIDDYESYEMPMAPGITVTFGEEVEMTPLLDLVPGPSTSSMAPGITVTFGEEVEMTPLLDLVPGPSTSSMAPGITVTFGEEVEMTPLLDLVPGPSTSLSAISFYEVTTTASLQASSHDISRPTRVPRSRSRLDKLRNMEKRDPSPVPSMQNLLTSFINTTRRTHGPFSEAEKDSLMQQAKIYKQLNIDTFVRGRDIRGNSNENHMERGEHHKDENDNKQMDI